MPEHADTQGAPERPPLEERITMKWPTADELKAMEASADGVWQDVLAWIAANPSAAARRTIELQQRIAALEAERDRLRERLETADETECLLRAEAERLRVELRTTRDVANGDFWYWQGDGDDHLGSLVCPVVIRPDELAALITPRTTEAPDAQRCNCEQCSRHAAAAPWLE